MYTPKSFRVSDVRTLHDMIERIGGAAIVSHHDNEFHATHAPIDLVRSPAPYGKLRVHFARANPHWQALAEDGDNVLVIFQGPQRYVTPSWYATKAKTAEVVPTWNFVAVHAHCAATVHEDADWLRAQVNEMTDRHEAKYAHPWKVADAPQAYVDKQLRAIVGVELFIRSLEGKWKLSQNRSPEDKQGVRDGFAEHDDHVLVELMDGLSD